MIDATTATTDAAIANSARTCNRLLNLDAYNHHYDDNIAYAERISKASSSITIFLFIDHISSLVLIDN